MCVCASFRDKHEMKTRFSRAHPLCASRFPLLPLVSDFDSDSGATSPSLNTDMDGQQQAYGVQRSLSLLLSLSRSGQCNINVNDTVAAAGDVAASVAVGKCRSNSHGKYSVIRLEHFFFNGGADRSALRPSTVSAKRMRPCNKLKLKKAPCFPVTDLNNSFNIMIFIYYKLFCIFINNNSNYYF